jgi:arylformamidase
MSEWIDISVPLHNGMPHWPGDQAFTIKRDHDMNAGAGNNLSEFTTSSHTGTHMDAPVHFIRGGKGIDEIPLSAVVGRARVLAIKDPENITVEELRPHNIGRGERILFRTRNSDKAWAQEGFQEDFVAIPPETARYLAECRPALVGVDYLSVGHFQGGGAETHQAILGAGIWIVEGLDLSAVRPGDYDLVCLPIKVQGADGALARAILRPVAAD